MNVQMNLSRNLKDKPADESKLGFGHIFTDHMLMINYTDGKGWARRPHRALRQPFAGPCLPGAALWTGDL